MALNRSVDFLLSEPVDNVSLPDHWTELNWTVHFSSWIRALWQGKPSQATLVQAECVHWDIFRQCRAAAWKMCLSGSLHITLCGFWDALYLSCLNKTNPLNQYITYVTHLSTHLSFCIRKIEQMFSFITSSAWESSHQKKMQRNLTWNTLQWYSL